MTFFTTTSQTVGPYFSIGLSPLYRNQLAASGVAGEPITIQGRITDGEDKPVPDAALEIWQADAEGKFPLPEDAGSNAAPPFFFGFGRVPTDEKGAFCFSTIKPGCVLAPEGAMQAPHILVSIFMRGLLHRLVTRIYFSGDPRNGTDYVLKLVDPRRREALLAAL